MKGIVVMKGLVNNKIQSNDKIYRRNNLLIRVFIVLIILLLFILAQNNLVLPRSLVYTNFDLPKSFVGYKIAHISDIDNTSNNIDIQLGIYKPNIILLSGGYSDKNGKYDKTLRLIKKMLKVAPVYYIYNTDDEVDILDGIGAYNIVDKKELLRPLSFNEDAFINSNYGGDILEKAKNGDEKAYKYVEYIKSKLEETKDSNIELIGLSNYENTKTPSEYIEKVYNISGKDNKNIRIFLNGNIRNIKALVKTDTNMILSGGTYGKDVNGYKKGNYSKNKTEIFISGGLSSKQGFRIFNQPELQIITLSDGTIKKKNLLEKFIGIFIKDVGTIFDNDGGFKEYRKKY